MSELTPMEASKHYQIIFDEYQAKFRNLHEEMNKAINDGISKNKEVESKLASIAELEKSIKLQESMAETKNKEAGELLEQSQIKLQNAKEEEKRLIDLKLSLEKTDAALSKQREEIAEANKSLAEREKQVEIDERAIKFDRSKVDRLIKDNQIKEMMK